MAINDNVGLSLTELMSGEGRNDGGLFHTSAINPYNYSSIAVSAQTLVKSGAGTLHGVSVLTNNISGIAFYDNVVSGGTTIFTLPVSAMNISTFWQFDTNFATGLVVSSGSSNTSVVISYI